MADARGPLRIYYFTFYASMAVYLPYFPSWLRGHGIDGLSMSVLMALLPTMNVFGPPGFGLLADSLGLRGRLLKWAATGAAVSFVPLMMYTLAADEVSFPVVFATCLGFAFFRTPMNLMADVVALEQGDDFSRLRLWGSLGFMIAVPIVGHYLNLSLAWGLPALMALLLCLSQVTTLWMPDQAKVPQRAVFKDVKHVMADRGFLAFLCAACLGQAAHVGYDMVLSMHLQDLGMSGTGVGWAWALATASEVGVMAYAPRFLSSGNAPRLLMLSLVVQALRWVLMSVVTDHAWLLALQGLHAVSFGLRWVACMLIVSRIGQRVGALATIQGLHLTATSLGSVLGMFLAGLLFKSAGGSHVFAASAGLAAAGSVCALVYSLLPADGWERVRQENAA
jgi:MFS transporter, PPP family, 3-phenylpropionic acid transporter